MDISYQVGIITFIVRFDMPDFKNPDKAVNRIVNNLLYFQSNYFISAVLIFLLIRCDYLYFCSCLYFFFCSDSGSCSYSCYIYSVPIFFLSFLHPGKMFLGMLTMAICELLKLLLSMLLLLLLLSSAKKFIFQAHSGVCHKKIHFFSSFHPLCYMCCYAKMKFCHFQKL